MTTATSTTSPEKLREDDLEVGKPFVHPQTRLEYADFHAYLCGKDPIPHWRNARIKDVHEQARQGLLSHPERHIEAYLEGFDRNCVSRFGINHSRYSRGAAEHARTVTVYDGVVLAAAAP